jgi:hypothetical protein
METETATLRIRALNDSARRNPTIACQVFVTSGVSALPDPDKAAIWNRVCDFDAFTPENDPHGEHDFGSFEHKGQTIFWKIDYYDLMMKCGSPDPSDPVVTRRVLTIMLAEEY